MSSETGARCRMRRNPFLFFFKGVPTTETYEHPQDRRLALTKYILHYNLWLYLVADPSGQTVAETVINNIADAIDAATQSAPFPRRKVSLFPRALSPNGRL